MSYIDIVSFAKNILRRTHMKTKIFKKRFVSVFMAARFQRFLYIIRPHGLARRDHRIESVGLPFLLQCAANRP